MSLIYRDDSTSAHGRSGGFVDFSKFDANKMFNTHFANSLYLMFFLQNGTTVEKHKASNEMKICERKMKFWKNQKTFDHEQMLRDCIETKKKWKIV